MKTTLLTKIPAGSPAGELLKLATIIAVTVLTDKIGDIVKIIIDNNEVPTIIDAKEGQ